MSTKITEFTVDRSKWARGGKNGEARLQNDQDCRCCLGLLAIACGASEDEIKLGYNPEEVPLLAWPSGILDDSAADSQLTKVIVRTNDLSTVTESDRERHLKRDFESLGITVHFVDGESE